VLRQHRGSHGRAVELMDDRAKDGRAWRRSSARQPWNGDGRRL